MVSRAIRSTGSRKRIQPDVSASYCFAVPEKNIIEKFVELYQPIMHNQSLIRAEN